MNRAEARIAKFKNSNTQLAGNNNMNISWIDRMNVMSNEINLASKLSRKRKKKG